MYIEHFGLREPPFRITPHTEFFFAGGNRGATLEALVYAITHDEGIVKVSGEVGSGKTMLCRMLLERLPANVVTVYLANPSLSRDEILYAIADELGMPLPEGRVHMLLRTLQERLLEIYAEGKQVVVLIDEAHAMPAETLEEVRLLSNLESNRHKLLQIVLFGQPELDARLAQTDMRQLKERITHNFALEPLKRNDIASYLMFRMRAAGYRGPDLFTPAAIHVITHASEGLTRRINILADKALLSAYSQNTHQVDQREAKAAVKDAQFKPMADGSAKPGTWITAAAAGFMLAAGIAALTWPRQQPPVAEVAKTQPPLSAPPAATAAPALPPVLAQKSEATASAPSDTPSVVPTTPTASRQPAGGNARGPGPLTAARLSASQSWVQTATSSHYFIQLLSADAGNSGAIEQFLATNAPLLDDTQLRAYRSSLSGQDRIGIIYGDFRTRAEAQAAIGELPKSVRATQPHPRQVSRLR